MIVHPIVASVVGQVTDTRWGQVLQTPHAYGVVEMYTPNGYARERGIAVLTELTNAFASPPVSLGGLTEIADRVMRDDIVSLVLLVPVGSTLYMVSRGNGKVYLKRGEQLAILLTQSQSLSGDARVGDVLIVATAGFVQTLSSDEIISVFDHLTPSEVAEKLTMRLHEKEGGEGGAALIFQVGEVAPDEELEEEKKLDEVMVRPSPTAPPMLLHRAKAVGRRVTTLKQRILLRKIAAMIRKHPAFSVQRVVTIIVVSLFLLSVVLGIRHQQLAGTRSALTETLTEAQHAFDEGMALLDLNPVKGRDRLNQAKDLLAPVVSKKLQSADGQKANKLYAEVVDNLTRSMHITKVTPSVFYDVSLLKQGAAATELSLFEDTMGVLDMNGKTVFAVGASSKSGSVVGGGDTLTKVSHIAVYGDKVYVWTPNGISMIRLSDQKTVPNVIPASSEWGTISQMVAFGGNLYLLDTQKSRIWKYVATDKGLPAGRQGFSELFEYLNPDTLPDLSKTTNMAIDGSVWLGTTTGTIMRFTSGKENPYVMQGADTPLGANLEVSTDDSTKMVYVLDADHHRVVVFDKDGLYMSQYVWENTLRVTEIAASESLHTLFLLADGKLYSVTLQ